MRNLKLVRFDTATRFRSDIPFGPNLTLIDTRSIPIISVRDCSSHGVFSMLDLNAYAYSLNALNACSHGGACRVRTPIIVLNARIVDRSIERLRLTQERLTLLRRPFLSLASIRD